MASFKNPFRPGAGHMPPFLAGRDVERTEFLRLLEQEIILENAVLTGLRGVGKTVLLESFKPLSIERRWVWVGTDLSESVCVSEDSIAKRLCTDLSLVTSDLVVGRDETPHLGFSDSATIRDMKLGFRALRNLYEQTPGLSSDKLKAVLEVSWLGLRTAGARGIIFAYDEAQTLSDQASRDQYPLSLVLDVFQSLQRRNLPLMLVLTGLPTLFPKLVDARTFSERMFRVVFLERLTRTECRDAILKPIEDAACSVRLDDQAVDTIIRLSGGYPYFIQFICREAYDALLQRPSDDHRFEIPVAEIERKLDSDFFAGRWARATDRQRELLSVIARLEHCEQEFTVQDIVAESKVLATKAFSSSHANQMLSALGDQGLVFKNRHGRYSFAVPMLGQFIRRQMSDRGD